MVFEDGQYIISDKLELTSNWMQSYKNKLKQKKVFPKI